MGALQFGDARLQDYKKATGSSFTQDEFKANSALQARSQRGTSQILIRPLMALASTQMAMIVMDLGQ